MKRWLKDVRKSWHYCDVSYKLLVAISFTLAVVYLALGSFFVAALLLLLAISGLGAGYWLGICYEILKREGKY